MSREIIIHEDISPTRSPITAPAFSSVALTSSAIQYWLDTLVDHHQLRLETSYWHTREACDGAAIQSDKENKPEIRSDDKRNTHSTSWPANKNRRRHILGNLPMAEAQERARGSESSPRKRRIHARNLDGGDGHTRVQSPSLTHGTRDPVPERASRTDEDFDDDVDATPRSNTQPASTLFGGFPDPPPLFSIVPHSAGSSSSKGSSRSRSQSPTKVGMFQMSSLPIIFRSFGAPGFPTPISVRSLYKHIKDISEHGDAVVPAFLQTHVNFSDEGIRQHQVATSWPNEAWTEEVFWSKIEEVQWHARECRDERLSESAWNSEVHCRLLKLALFGEWQSKGVWYRDVTTAKIDKTLVPRVNEVAMASKMVDYCLVLDGPDLRARVIRKLQSAGLFRINHSTAEYLQYTPIAVSIETKRGAIDEDAANAQLGIWVCAQFSQLRKLVPAGAPLPILLLIIIQGDDWKLMTAEYSSSDQIQLLKYLSMGNTSSVLGICKVVASLRSVAAYVQDVYLPWFERYVLAGF